MVFLPLIVLLSFLAHSSAVGASVELAPVVSGSNSDVTPQNQVSLNYASSNSSIQATVNVIMMLPSILLEEIDCARAVTCSQEGVNVTFSNQTSWNQAYGLWPSSNFLFITNHLGNCDGVNNRGFYLVDSVSFDNGSLTVISSSSKIGLKDYASSASIRFNSSTSLPSRKRDTTATVSADLSGVLVNATDLNIDVTEADFTSTLDFSGGVDFDFLTFHLEALYVDFDLSASADLAIAANASASYSHSLYSYTPASLSVSAFTIPDILSVGPYIEFSVGIEFGVSVAVDTITEATFDLTDGKVHLDLVNYSDSNISGWTPTYTNQANISVDAEVQLNPYAETTVGFGIDVLDGLVNLSAGIEAKPEIVNAFWSTGAFSYSSDSGVSIVKGTGSCTNGLWYESIFDFSITAFVGSLWSAKLYDIEVPIYRTNCVSWV